MRFPLILSRFCIILSVGSKKFKFYENITFIPAITAAVVVSTITKEVLGRRGILQCGKPEAMAGICRLKSESGHLFLIQNEEMPLKSRRGSVFPQLTTYLAAFKEFKR